LPVLQAWIASSIESGWRRLNKQYCSHAYIAIAIDTVRCVYMTCGIGMGYGQRCLNSQFYSLHRGVYMNCSIFWDRSVFMASIMGMHGRNYTADNIGTDRGVCTASTTGL
jgi:hypothetical protein